MNQGSVDARIQDYYTEHFVEAEHLTVRSVQGRLEFERVQELIACRIGPHSHVLDIGGATGVHAPPLAELGHHVVLIDPVPAQVHEAKRVAANRRTRPGWQPRAAAPLSPVSTQVRPPVPI